MAADLERLQAVVGRLAPLSSAVTGDLIRAQDWNALVLAVVDIARAVLAEGPSTVPPHDHVGQVKSSWLDARLATTLERGALADPEAAARLAGAEHAVSTVDGRVGSLTSEITQLRLRLNEVASRDLERESQVSSLGLRVSGLQDSGEDVQQMRGTLASVQEALGRALAVAQQLTVNGVPVDIGKLGQRLSELETFREGLREPDGSLLDARQLRADLQAATAALVTKEQLASEFANRATALTPAQMAGISDRVSAALRSEFSVQFSQFGDAIRADTDQRLSSLNAVVTAAVADAVPSTTDAVLARLRPEMATALAASAATQQSRTEQRLSEVGTSLRSEFDGKLVGTRTELTTSLQAEIGRQVGAGLAPFQGALADLSTRHAATAASVADLNTRTSATADALTRLSTSVTTVGQRVDAVAAADAAARATLETSMRSELAVRDAKISQVDSRVSTLDTSVSQRLTDTASALRLELRRTPPIVIGSSTRIPQ